MLRKIISVLLTLAVILQAAGEVNVYSHRHYAADKKLFKAFEEQTGIRVNVVKASSSELINRLAKEGMHSPADVLITVDVGRLYKAKQLGLLKPLRSDYMVSVIPENLRDAEGYWYGLTKRARVIAYSLDRVDPKTLSTYEALAGDAYKGRLLIQKSSNIYNQSLLASMIAHRGAEKAKAWAAGIVENFARTPTGDDRDQMRAVAAGIGDVAVVNTYYIGQLLNSRRFSDRAVAEVIGVFFPNQQGRGTHINISGIGVTASSKHEANARRFVEFLAGEAAQRVFAEVNYEYPVNRNVAPSELLKSWGVFKEDAIALERLGEHNAEAVRLFDEAGWH